MCDKEIDIAAISASDVNFDDFASQLPVDKCGFGLSADDSGSDAFKMRIYPLLSTIGHSIVAEYKTVNTQCSCDPGSIRL